MKNLTGPLLFIQNYIQEFVLVNWIKLFLTFMKLECVCPTSDVQYFCTIWTLGQGWPFSEGEGASIVWGYIHTLDASPDAPSSQIHLLDAPNPLWMHPWMHSLDATPAPLYCRMDSLPLPSGLTNTCKNITFPELRLPAVTMVSPKWKFIGDLSL